MKTYKTLYPYLSKVDVEEGRSKVVNLLIKVGKFSNKNSAEGFVALALDKKANGADLNELECEVITFFNRLKREKSPQYKALVNAKGIIKQMPNNSKVTF